jgi:hypothetical protein
MAVFLIRAIMGGDTFPYNAAPYFTDVSTSHPFFKFIQKMKELGITSGCNATAYCPDDTVSRGQMAVFLVRGRFGTRFQSSGTPYFTDVSSNHPFFAYIQKMREMGITSGCGTSSYCPDNSNTRGQMAVFLVRGFFTPW